MDFVMDNSAILPIRKTPNILVRDPGDDLLDNIFALTSYDHVDIGTTLEQVLHFKRRFVTANNRADLGRQLRYEITDLLELRFPPNADAQQVNPAGDKLAKDLRLAVSAFISKIEERNFADQVFHARDDILQAGRRKHPHRCGRIPEIRVQC